MTRGKELRRHAIGCVDIACLDKLAIRLETSDGRPSIARSRLLSSYHMGGFDAAGDSYDTQLWQFEKLLDEFWNELIGPHESLRQKLLNDMACLYDEWRKAVITEDGRLEIYFKDGSCREVRPGA